MLYKSLQQTIQEYEQRKKQTQTEGQRKMFKWKVFALTLCIIAIILIGILSQLIKFQDQNLPQTHNFTFLPTLLKHSQQLDQISSVKALLYGLNKSPRITYDKSEMLFNQSQIFSQQLIKSIEGKRNLLYLFHFKEQTAPEDQSLFHRFGILLKTQYDSKIDPENNSINVIENVDDLSSVYFNLDENQALRMNLHSDCRIYSFNETSKIIRIMETLQLANDSEGSDRTKVNFELKSTQCFGSDQKQALNQIESLTGIHLASKKQVKTLQFVNIQVFYLTLNDENVQ